MFVPDTRRSRDAWIVCKLQDPFLSRMERKLKGECDLWIALQDTQNTFP